MEVKFHKNFNKIPIKIQESFYERLDLFFQDKYDKILSNHSVDKTFPNCKSINISGDYRAIFEETGETAIFITIETHASLY